MKSLKFHSMKSVIFTKLESSTNQKRAEIAYKIDTGSDENIMPFRFFRILFPRSTMAELNATINRSIVLKAYIQSNIEQLSRCSVKIRHNHKCIKCRLFVVPGNGPSLLRMLDIELLSISRVTCDTINNKTNKRSSMCKLVYSRQQTL